MTKQELQDAYCATPEWKDHRAKERIWFDLDDLADDYRKKANQAEESTREAQAALYATPEYKAWLEGQDD